MIERIRGYIAYPKLETCSRAGQTIRGVTDGPPCRVSGRNITGSPMYRVSIIGQVRPSADILLRDLSATNGIWSVPSLLNKHRHPHRMGCDLSLGCRMYKRGARRKNYRRSLKSCRLIRIKLIRQSSRYCDNHAAGGIMRRRSRYATYADGEVDHT